MEVKTTCFRCHFSISCEIKRMSWETFTKKQQATLKSFIAYSISCLVEMGWEKRLRNPSMQASFVMRFPSAFLTESASRIIKNSNPQSLQGINSRTTKAKSYFTTDELICSHSWKNASFQGCIIRMKFCTNCVQRMNDFYSINFLLSLLYCTIDGRPLDISICWKVTLLDALNQIKSIKSFVMIDVAKQTPSWNSDHSSFVCF